MKKKQVESPKMPKQQDDASILASIYADLPKPDTKKQPYINKNGVRVG